ncbi:MAG: dTDP-4-dehydrorhamnose 3,5-epimerase [Flavobacteriales bacterium]|nr:MAG: dTDP-4-dehydrorhamnose 3,5-epimerase [Flavobacteriales bacterium]
MEFIDVEIEGLVIIEPNVFEDGRGYFYESYNKDEFDENGIIDVFVQDNQSLSQKNVLRGLHFQKPPFSQSKLIRVVQGIVLDIAVDLRKNSKTYGKYCSVELSASNKKMFYIPEGFAHGFLTLEDDTIFSYKCNNFYNAASEDAILWNDKNLNIYWGIDHPILSEKDKKAQNFNQYVSPF